ncbi:unnamed protein product, partial [Ixodes hexagonus]
SFSAVLPETPLVLTSTGVVSGQRFEIGGNEVDAFYGIPYAKPPVGELRFQKPQPSEAWNGTYEATTKPTACKQLGLRFLKDVTLDYTNSSEDCLYVNVWKPANICRGGEVTCDKKLPVVVYIYGGGFQWGDSGLLVYDAANFVGLSDIVFVSFNHRLSLLGFLSVGTSDLPGNAGFWDQLLALKWVNKNIKYFGGNPDDVTLGGHSAGAISAGLHAASPHSKGLFHRIIMQSGSPLSLILGLTYKGAGRFLDIAGKIDCYDAEKDWKEEISNIIACMKKIDASELFDKLEQQDPVNQLFSPVFGDDFLPADPLSLSSWKQFHVKEVLTGTTTNEGTLFVDNIRYASPELETILSFDYRLGVVFSLSVLFQIPLKAGHNVVREYFGADEIEHDQPTVYRIFSEIVGDMLINCPVDLFEEITAQQGISTYRYVFDHRPSYSLWPKSFGVAHSDDITFTLGSLRFIADTTRHTAPLGPSGSKILSTLKYTRDEESFMKQLVGVWSSFAKSGKMKVPLSNEPWPEYTSKNPDFINMQPNNFTKTRIQRRCLLFRPFLLKN